MFAIAVESSHHIGMGHFYRMLHFVSLLKDMGESYLFCINNNYKIQTILSELNEPFQVVNFEDSMSNWESKFIKTHEINYWINDRLESNITHFKNIKENNIALISFDDIGEGAIISDLNIVTLPSMQQFPHFGNKIIRGLNFFIINPEIDNYKKQRSYNTIRLCVSLGGSDTHGVTIHVLKKLKQLDILADIHIGPSFEHLDALKNELVPGYRLIDSPKSLISVLTQYNLLISGGGITPFEANALGIPCLIIANEPFEIKNAQFLQQLGSSLFLGFHESIDWHTLENYYTLDLKSMSRAGLNNITTQGLTNIYNEIKAL